MKELGGGDPSAIKSELVMQRREHPYEAVKL